MDLNNRQTGKDATKPRALGLLGHSDITQKITVLKQEQICSVREDKPIEIAIFTLNMHVLNSKNIRQLELFFLRENEG